MTPKFKVISDLVWKTNHDHSPSWTLNLPPRKKRHQIQAAEKRKHVSTKSKTCTAYMHTSNDICFIIMESCFYSIWHDKIRSQRWVTESTVLIADLQYHVEIHVTFMSLNVMQW